jgi:alkanesulfonate monooxygenase SsuD/methylene tetrahydromethanopterin reductase-like flavin-dependent oxidoreductase (luciferase family)
VTLPDEGKIERLEANGVETHNGQYYQANKARLYDLPPQPVPIYFAAAGPKSARLAGQYGDGWIAPGDALMNRRCTRRSKTAHVGPARIPPACRSSLRRSW